jgi:hypothetical protein
MGCWMRTGAGLEVLKTRLCHTVNYSYKMYGLQHFFSMNTSELGPSLKENQTETNRIL